MSTSTKPPTPRIYASVKQAGEMVGLSTYQIQKLCDTERVESYFYGRRRLVALASLVDYIENLPTLPTVRP